jgi:Flp pilus assembly protein TadG
MSRDRKADRQTRGGLGARRLTERGATLIEASLVFPILILVVVSLLELGMLFKDYLTVSALSREGARIGALAGDDPVADCAILIGLEGLATPGDLARLEDIEIYRASANGAVTAGPNVGSYVGGGPAKCSVPAQVDDTWTLNSAPWPPSSRAVEVGATLSPDIIGVRIQMDHPWITGFPPYSGIVHIDERTITRLEPKAFFPQP